MSRTKTCLLVLLFLPTHGMARAIDLIVTFASCTGRFSAELEHAWLMQDARSEELAHYRQQFVDLLDATVATDQRRDMLSYRIQAKLAHASLLTQATFSDDEGQSEWAARRAAVEVNYCASFLLDS